MYTVNTAIRCMMTPYVMHLVLASKVSLILGAVFLLPAVSNYQTSQWSGIVSVVVKQVKGHLLNCPPASLPDRS